MPFREDPDFLFGPSSWLLPCTDFWLNIPGHLGDQSGLNGGSTNTSAGLKEEIRVPWESEQWLECPGQTERILGLPGAGAGV